MCFPNDCHENEHHNKIRKKTRKRDETKGTHPVLSPDVFTIEAL